MQAEAALATAQTELAEARAVPRALRALLPANSKLAGREAPAAGDAPVRDGRDGAARAAADADTFELLLSKICVRGVTVARDNPRST